MNPDKHLQRLQSLVESTMPPFLHFSKVHSLQVMPDQKPTHSHSALSRMNVEALTIPLFAQVAEHPTNLLQVSPVKLAGQEHLPVSEMQDPPLLHTTLAHLSGISHEGPEYSPTQEHLPSFSLHVPPFRHMTLLALHKLVIEKVLDVTHRSLVCLTKM